MSGGDAERVRVSLSEPARGRLVATVTVDRPAKLNALTGSMMDELATGVGALSAETNLAAVVLTGAGSKAFIGGADITEMAQLDEDAARAYIARLHRCCAALRALPVPVIARIEGYALGAGMEIAAACDLRVASADAVFGMPEVRIGIPSVIEAALLPMLVGWGRAREILLLGQTFPAERAASWGFVERLAPIGTLDAAVDECVEALLAGGPNAVRAQKALIRRWEQLPVEDAIEVGIETFASAFRTEEPRRMMSAFIATKRQ